MNISPPDPKSAQAHGHSPAEQGQASSLLTEEAARQKRKAVLNLSAMGLISVGLCFGGWYAIRQPGMRSQNKAQLTAQYYLEALGQAPIHKLGEELYPDIRRSLNPDTYQVYLKQLGLDQNLKTLSWQTLPTNPKVQQWNWLVQVQPEAGTAFPLIMMVRLPEEMAMSKRWHVYRICRLDHDLRREAQRFIDTQQQAAATASVNLQGFTPAPAADWQIDTSKIQIKVPNQNQSTEVLILKAEVEAAKQGPGCTYSLHGNRSAARAG